MLAFVCMCITKLVTVDTLRNLDKNEVLEGWEELELSLSIFQNILIHIDVLSIQKLNPKENFFPFLHPYKNTISPVSPY